MKDEPSRDVVVFTEALKVSVQERGAFLERVCAGDENLRRNVEALLRAHDRGNGSETESGQSRTFAYFSLTAGAAEHALSGRTFAPAR
jgi:hypothetical protein